MSFIRRVLLIFAAAAVMSLAVLGAGASAATALFWKTGSAVAGGSQAVVWATTWCAPGLVSTINATLVQVQGATIVTGRPFRTRPGPAFVPCWGIPRPQATLLFADTGAFIPGPARLIDAAIVTRTETGDPVASPILGRAITLR